MIQPNNRFQAFTSLRRWSTGVVLAMAFIGFLSGCAGLSVPVPGGSGGGSAGSAAPELAKVDPGQAERIKRIMLPLVRNMDKQLQPGEVRIGVIDSPEINAANAGNGVFYVTTGLLRKADDERLRGVLAHEVAHEDLGHVAKAQAIGTGLQIGTIILDQIFPGSGAVTPLIADLGVMRPYSRSEEYSADEHGVEILNRAGYNGEEVMADTLSWLMKSTGGGGGGFFSTHPGTEDRIARIREMS
jgi:Zn-dependent protease with chaperone function